MDSRTNCSVCLENEIILTYLLINQFAISSSFFFRFKFLLPDFNNDELIHLMPFDELSKMALNDIEFDYSQV